MEIWLDSINEELIAKANTWGILDGVTTNPAILAESDQIESTIKALLAVQKGPITCQITSDRSDEMLSQALYFAQISDRIIVKVPVTQEGLQVIHRLSQKGIKTMATIIYDYRQYLLSAKAGALYAAPYYSSIIKAGGNADHEIARMCKSKERYGLKTKILAASLQNLQQFDICADMGVDAVTLKDAVFMKLMEDHPVTLERVEAFLEAWNKRTEAGV